MPNVNFVLTPGGDGLLGQYYDNTDFTSLMVTRIDPQINFDWGGVAPDPSMGVTTSASAGPARSSPGTRKPTLLPPHRMMA